MFKGHVARISECDLYVGPRTVPSGMFYQCLFIASLVGSPSGFLPWRNLILRLNILVFITFIYWIYLLSSLSSFITWSLHFPFGHPLLLFCKYHISTFLHIYFLLHVFASLSSFHYSQTSDHHFQGLQSQATCNNRRLLHHVVWCVMI